MSNEERTLNPVGGAITSNYVGDLIVPRYVCTLIGCAYALQFLSVGSSGSLRPHGSVFPSGPSPENPYAIQLSRYYNDILSQIRGNGNGEKTRAKVAIALPRPEEAWLAAG